MNIDKNIKKKNVKNMGKIWGNTFKNIDTLRIIKNFEQIGSYDQKRLLLFDSLHKQVLGNFIIY